MGRIYNLLGENLTMGTGSVLASMATSTTELAGGGRLKIKRVEVTQSATATAAMVRLALSKRDQAATLTMTSKTPVPVDYGGLASLIVGGTAGHTPLNSGVASSADSGGTYVDLWNASFCNLNGWLWIPTPGEELIIHNTSVFVVRFLAAPATTTGWTIGICFEEL